jgi:microcystin-dependent protein
MTDLKTYAINDISAMTNILNFLNNIKDDTLNISKQIRIDKLTINNNLTLYNTGNIIEGDMKFNIDKVELTTSGGYNNNRYLDIFPRYTILLYNSRNLAKLPKRWVLCDGKKWYVHKTKYNDSNSEYPLEIGFNDTEAAAENAFIQQYKTSFNTEEYNINNDFDIIHVPDLRGRFIIGSDNNKYKINSRGGTDKALLEKKHLPAHTHPSYLALNKDATKSHSMLRLNYFGHKLTVLDINTNETEYKIMDIDEYGNFGYGEYYDNGPSYEGAYPHENMPPYYVSQYIMKL